MFGFVRLFLACMVVVGHLFWFADFGRYAVFGFYVLSGYLMTMVMHGSYGYTQSGIIKFISNRFLRLYPAYWIACLFSIALIVFYGQASTTAVEPDLALPTTLTQIVANSLMLFPSLFPNQFVPKLSPATWALTVEITYYLLIAFGISATRQRTLVWVLLSFLYLILTIVVGYSWHARYFAIPAGSLPFSIGALLYFLNKENWYPTWMQSPLLHPKILLAALVLNACVGSVLQNYYDAVTWMEVSFYCNLPISALLVYRILRGGQVFALSKQVDKKLGDFSYPVYLIHWQVAVVVSSVVLDQVGSLKYQVLPVAWLLTTLLLVVLSLVLIHWVDKPIELLREKLRGKPAY
jgi:peptidoglycan/LPS O-acetylase OafA/YrhL